MMAQMRAPPGAIPTLPTAPIFLPFGSLAQPSTMRYGFGRTCASAVPPPTGDVTRAHAANIPRVDATISPSRRARRMTPPRSLQQLDKLLLGVSRHLLRAD